MNRWFISDTHWSHKNIIKYSNRPFFDTREMNEALTENWNKLVKPGDEVYHLGDFAFCSYNTIREIMKNLNGKIHFIHGNHDRDILNNSHELIQDKYFESITPYKEIKVGKQYVIMFHYGCRTWNKAHHGSWHLYGHSHGSLEPFGKSVDVGVDAKFIHSEYRPTHYDEIEAFMNTRNFVAVDHHGD